MATTKGFQIDRRVDIALDALTDRQKACLMPMLESRESFVAHTARPGATERLVTSRPLYLLRTLGDLQIVYSVVGENIIVEDLMRKATINSLTTKRPRAKSSSKGRSAVVAVDQDKPAGVHND